MCVASSTLGFVNVCEPSTSPCGPNSQCRVSNDSGQAICSCLMGFLGTPPTCRPECVTSMECPLEMACVQQKCINPCEKSPCGQNTVCRVRNHSPICTCSPGTSGDPFTRCNPMIPPSIISKKSYNLPP